MLLILVQPANLSTRIDFPGIPKELILLRIQFSSIKFIKSYKNLIQIELG